MTPGIRNSTKSQLGRQKRRRLRFDILEDRRLLAGIEVFLFNDLDASRSHDPIADESLWNKAVFLDLNNNGGYDGSEPWAVSDANGLARFNDVEPGSYSVRLLGNNRSLVQTLPTLPSQSGVWADSIGTVVDVLADGRFWAARNSELTLRESTTFQSLRTVDFGLDPIVDVAILPNDGVSTKTAVVLTRNDALTQSLWSVSLEGESTPSLIAADLQGIVGLTAVGKRVILQSDLPSQKLALLDDGIVTPINYSVLESLQPGFEVKSTGNNQFAILETSDHGSTLTVCDLMGGSTRVVGRRAFDLNVTAWQVSGTGEIAVSTSEGVVVLSIGQGLPVRSSLPNAVGPIVFDSVRDLLFTGLRNDGPINRMIGWDTSDWRPSLTIPLSPEAALTEDASIHLDLNGRYLLGSVGDRVYQHDIASAVAANVLVAESGTTRLQFGVRFVGPNNAPVLSSLDAIALNEDESFDLTDSSYASKASDTDGNSIVYVVKGQPSNGTIVWSQGEFPTFKPSTNFSGADQIVVQAYDGIDWSESQTLAFNVASVNDQPTQIDLSTLVFKENPSSLSVLANVSVNDPDQDASYDFETSDPRFVVVGGMVRLISGELNFEKEPLLVIGITAVDRNHPADRISRNVTVSLSDENDAPSDITVPSTLSVPELTKGAELGSVSVVDEDAETNYFWSVSDSRFEIVDGKLRLAQNVELDFESQSTIGVSLRATDAHSQFSIEKRITVSVTDQDDPPVDLILTGSGTVGENRPGAVFGNVTVMDPDQGELYAVSVSDPRFEVVRGVAKLKSGVSLSYADPGFLDLTFTARSLRSGATIQKSSRLSIVKDTTPYHNDLNPYDVDGDGSVTPLDPLVVINYINRRGVGPVVEPGEGEGSNPDLDVDGDGVVSPLDILILINRINNDNRGTAEGSGGSGNTSGGNSGSGGGGLTGEGEGSAPLKTETLVRSTDMTFAQYISDSDDAFGPKRARRR